jgi:hypothetical protein
LLEASAIIKNRIGSNDPQFCEKYNVDFPMRTLEDLNAFQDMLKTNKSCREDFVCICA